MGIVSQELRMNNRNLAEEFNKLKVESDNKENEKVDGNKEVLVQLSKVNKSLETLTKTVLLMEKRISLVEEQVKLLSQK